MNHWQRDLLERLHNAGVILQVDVDRLRYRAPRGALTPELRAALEELKPELVYEYHERAGILEYDARLASPWAAGHRGDGARSGIL